MKRQPQSGAEKNMKKDEARAAFLGSLPHFWLLTLITCFNVGNNLTTNNAYNVLSDFPRSLTKTSHGFTTNKIE